jgi:hypothetical protein
MSLIKAYEQLNESVGRDEYGREGSHVAYRVKWAHDKSSVTLYVLDCRLGVGYKGPYYRPIARGSENYIREVIEVLRENKVAPERAPNMGTEEYQRECAKYGLEPLEGFYS